MLFYERALSLRIAGVAMTLRASCLPGTIVARILVNQWLDSPGHRANLMSVNWARSAVGIAITTNGRIYATQLFAN